MGTPLGSSDNGVPAAQVHNDVLADYESLNPLRHLRWGARLDRRRLHPTISCGLVCLADE